MDRTRTYRWKQFHLVDTYDNYRYMVWIINTIEQTYAWAKISFWLQFSYFLFGNDTKQVQRNFFCQHFSGSLTQVKSETEIFGKCSRRLKLRKTLVEKIADPRQNQSVNSFCHSKHSYPCHSLRGQQMALRHSTASFWPQAESSGKAPPAACDGPPRQSARTESISPQ